MIKQGVLATMLLLGAVAVADNIIDQIVWVVGDQPILKSDVEKMKGSMREAGEWDEHSEECKLPEIIALQKLYLHQADLDSIYVTEAQVNSSLTNFFESRVLPNFGTEERFTQLTGQTSRQWRENYREEMRNRMRTEQVQQRIVDGVKVTPAEVRAFVKTLPTDSLPMIAEQVEVQILTETPVAPKEEVQRVEERLRDYTQRVNNGESFAMLARLYSQDEGSARQGGELGYTAKSRWVPEFANVAFSLSDPKKVSRIVRTEFGYHIIQLIDKKEDKVNARHILLKPVVPDSLFTRGLARLDSIRQDMIEAKFTFEEAVVALSDDKKTRNSRGIMTEETPMGISSRFEMRNLPTEVARAVSGLQVGELSRPFIYTNGDGKQVMAIVKLKNRIPQHRANVENDFAILQDIVLERKRQQKLQNWVAEKQKNTYVTISEGWKNCEFVHPGWVLK